ncbi:MAG: hypothetical protein IPO18_11350 [bacterium]|nr:hypothetical protein [bacterium]
MDSNAGKEFVQLNASLKSMIQEMDRLKSLSDELEAAHKSVAQASKAISDVSNAMGTAAAGMSQVTQEIVALDPRGLRKQIDDQNAKIIGALKGDVAEMSAKIRVVTALVGVSIALSVASLVYSVVGR